MGHLPDKTELAEMNAIEQQIRESAPPKKMLSYQIMNKIGEREMSRTRTRTKGKSSFMKRTAIVATTAAVLGVGVIGTGFVSPVMADTLKKIPFLGILYQNTSEEALQTAIKQGIVSEPDTSITHDGVTLRLANLLYDGTRLSFVLERKGENMPPNTPSPYLKEGEKLEGTDSEYAKTASTPEKDQLKGYIETPKILVNGKQIQAFGHYGDLPDWEGAYQVELSNGIKGLPDEFELTIQTKVTKVNEPFEFKVPVKIDNKAIVLKPNATKTSGDFTYTVKELNITPVSTRLVLDSKGPVPKSPQQTGDYTASKVYYEIVDDQGREVKPDMFGYFHREPDLEYHVDDLYSPFKDTPKSITIKPFTLTMKKADWSVVGSGKDSLGERTYLKDLEMTIPVNQ
ncbi:DUF4179 domain-containing protein [Paenibacillus azoreducens]|uniref:Tat pathway signal protein n=1 Tax=Paenibacillus azoreducens TaxID=116718 RepID=A0A919YA21_9BACL|nr:DUF4179 domain-containing protein [Paenibacillus azoreducens]GIO45303.1 hypothetical protein J34TS1_00680 [Paenibacillus azoreducens]